MNSSNFLPLKSRWPQFYQHATFAEHYAFSDPHTSIIKLRCFAEVLVGYCFRKFQLRCEPGDGFFEKLGSQDFQEIAGSDVITKFNAIRILGNKAAHGKAIDANVALAMIEEAYLIGQWFYKTLGEVWPDGYPAYTPPTNDPGPLEERNKAVENLAEQLAAANEELSRLEAAEKAAQEKIETLNQTINKAKLREFIDASIKAAQTIDFKSANTLKLISIHDAFAGYELNDGQTQLVKRLDLFLGSNTESVFLLKGYAGTGKTFITKGLTEYFQAIGRNYVLAAPTGKASKVIASKTKSPAYTIHKTIYSFDKLVEYRDSDIDGTETFKFYADLAVNDRSVDTVYIVDEASMIADVYQEAEFFRFGTGYLLSDFLKFVNLDHNDHNKKIIFIGDDAQLPPVGMKSSPALDANYLAHKFQVRSTTFELSEVVRQKSESGVIANAIPLRNSLKANIFNRLTIDFDHPDIHEVEHRDLMCRYLESCGGKINGESIIIANSNADVGDYNRRIREHFFPDCKEVMPRDRVMAVSNSGACGIFISNGDFGVIRQVYSSTESRTVTLKRKTSDSEKIEEIPVSLTFREVEVGFRDMKGVAHFFQTKIIENLLYSMEPTLSSDENKALYLDFCIRNKGLKRNSTEFKHALKSDPYFNALRLKFGYAITCHKAQGSEWNHVFVKCTNNRSQLSSEYFRWFYTAITRTVKHLYLLDPPSHEPWGRIKGDDNPGNILGATITPEADPADTVIPPLRPPIMPQKDSETFGIPASAQFLLALLTEVRKLIDGKGIAIDAVDHNRYQEAYHFKRETDSARINIAYNNKSKVTEVAPHQLTALADELAALLSSLKGKPLFVSGGTSVADARFAKQFLNDFHEKVLNLCGERGIAVQNVEEMPGGWSLRYSFSRANEVAVYDVYYNKQNVFTNCNPIANRCSRGTLIDDVGRLFTADMRV